MCGVCGVCDLCLSVVGEASAKLEPKPGMVVIR